MGFLKPLGFWPAAAMQLPAGESARLETITISGADRKAVSFDQSTDEYVILNHPRMPDNYTGGTLSIALLFYSTATSGNFRVDVSVEAITPTDSTNLSTTASFDAANSFTLAVSGTAGSLSSGVCTLTNKDSVAVGDFVRIKINRDADHGADTLAADLFLLGAVLCEDATQHPLDILYGTGDDGDVTISVNTELTRDMFYDDLTINSAVELVPNGFTVFVKGVLSGPGMITAIGQSGNSGSAGSGGVGGGGGTGLSFDGGATLYGRTHRAGSAEGGQGGGNVGSDPMPYLCLNPNDCAAGGGGGGGGGGAGGVATSPAGVVRYNPLVNGFDSAVFVNLDQYSHAAGWNSICGGMGGSGGGGGENSGGKGGGGGGSGGGGAGALIVFAKTVSGPIDLDAYGGPGGTGGNGEDGDGIDAGAGGGGGGAGGNGGYILLVSDSISSVTVDVTGGTAGSGGNGGADGGAGAGTAGDSGSAGAAGSAWHFNPVTGALTAL